MDENTRRLPPWMLAGATSGVTATRSQKVNKSAEVKRKPEPEATKTKAEKRQRRTAKPKVRDDSEKPKKPEKRHRSKIEEEAKYSSNDDVKNPEINQSVTDPSVLDLTVDDLLSFAHEYVESEEQRRKKHESCLLSESMVVQNESNIRSSQVGTNDANVTRDDMLDLLLGPFFKKSQQ